MSNSLQDETFGRLEWDDWAGHYVGRFELHPHEPVEVLFCLEQTARGDVRELLRSARRRLEHLRRREVGSQGYRRRAAKEILRPRPRPKGAAVAARMAESLRLERLNFYDTGWASLHYGSARAPDLQAVLV